jgi:hypothetical protein
MRRATSLESSSISAVSGPGDEYAATITLAESVSRAIARTMSRSVMMPTKNRSPATTARAPTSACSIRRAATARLSSMPAVKISGLYTSLIRKVPPWAAGSFPFLWPIHRRAGAVMP